MMKLAVFAALFAVTAAQMSPQMMYMMSSMGKGGGGGGSSAGGMGGMMSGIGGMISSMMGGGGGAMGGMGGMSRMFNNPMILCRKTENFRPVPCGSMPQFCDWISWSTYKFPGLMKCSPMGIGCCIKDARAMMMVNQLA